MASVGSPHGGSQAFHPPRMVGGTQGVQGGPGHGQEGRGAGQALRGRDSAPGAVATRAAALRKEPVGAKYMLTAPAPLMAPPGSRNAARCPPPRATSHCCRVQRCCQHGHSPPPRMLHQHPRVSRMAGPQGPGAGDPRDTAPRIPVPSPAAAVGHSLSGWTSTPVPPQKADCAGVPRPEVAEMHPLNPSGSAGPAAQWVAAAQFRCRGAGDPGDRRGCRGAVGAESRRLCPP